MDRRLPSAGRFAVAGTLTFALLTAVAGLLDAGYDPVKEPISALAAADAGMPYLAIAGFVAEAVALVAAAVVLARTLAGPAAKAGAALVAVAGVGMVVVGFARLDCSPAAASCLAREEAGLVAGSHWVHQLGSLGLFLALLVALPLLARGLRGTAGLRHLARPTRVAAALAPVALLATIAQFPAGYAGITQRVFLLVLFGWPAVLAVVADAPARRVPPAADVRAESVPAASRRPS